MDLDFLLSRGPDMALCAVRLHDVDLQPGAGAGAPGTATARGGDSCIVLVLPPQHIAEQTIAGPAVAPAPSVVVAAQLAGASRVSYHLDAGQVLSLTAAGILAACSAVRPGGPGPTDTWVELPFLLAFAPSAPGLRTEHADTPVAGPDGATGLWLARFRGDGATLSGDGLELHPLDLGLAGTPAPAFVSTPSAGLRARIAQSAAVQPAFARRLELTALGGNLAASGEWDGFSWHQRVSMGRDQFVRTEERGYLYPFGFPAVQTIVTERDPDSGIGAPIAPGQPIVLRTVTTLRLGRTVTQAAPGTVFSRTFPFDRVEVTAARFSGLALPVPDYVFDRPTYAVAELQGQIEQLQAHQNELAQSWGPFAGGTTTPQDVANSGNTHASTYLQLQGTIDANNGTIGSINQADAEKGAILDQIAPLQARLDDILREPQPPEGFGDNPDVVQLQMDIAVLWAQASQIFVNIELRNQLATQNADLERQCADLLRLFAHLVGLPRGAAEVASAGGEGSEAAWGWLQDQAAIDALNQRIAVISGAPHRVVVTEWPMQSATQRLLFPVRLSRGASVIEVAMPMVFVKDAHLAPVDDVVGYDWDQDPDLAARVDASWAGPTDVEIRAERTRQEAAAAAAVAAAIAAGREPDDVPAYVPPPPPPSAVAAGGALYDLVGSTAPQPSDTQVLRSLNIVARSLAPGDLFAPSLGRVAEDGTDRWGLQVDLPELQQLAGPAIDAAAGAAEGVAAGAARATTTAVVSFARDYVEQGETARALLESAETIGLDLTKAADRSGGLAAIQLAADAISREHGPVQLAGLLDGADPRELIGEAATLLGFKLRDLIQNLPTPPRIVSELVDGRTPTVSMVYEKVTLGDKPALGFRTSTDPARPTTFTLSAVSSPTSSVIDCQLTDFALQFPPGGHPLVRLDLTRLNFHQQTTYGGALAAAAPTLTVEGFTFTLLGELQLLEDLQNMVKLGDKLPGVRASARGVTAAFALPVPDVACGVFALTNLAFRSEIDVPFDGAPVALTIAFGSRDKPFALSVLAFSGGGYITIRIDADGPQIEASLEFGARLAVNFIVARGEVHALGGVTYKQIGGTVDVSGYLRLGGSLEILGLISVSIELRLSLAYQDKKLYGRATLVLEIDLTVWSDSVEIDSGLWEFQGGGSSAATRGVAATQSLAGREIGSGDLVAEADALAAVDDPVSDEELRAWQAYRLTMGGARR